MTDTVIYTLTEHTKEDEIGRVF